jgi:hypothetical protein
MNLAQKIKNLDTADVVTLGVGLALVLSDVFLTNRVRVGVAAEDQGNCPPGLTYDASTYTCVPQPAHNCPTGYTFANGTCNLNTATITSCPSGYTMDSASGLCLQNAPSATTSTPIASTTTATATPAYNTNISYYDTGSTVLQGLNTGINSLVLSLENMSGFYSTSSSVLQACQDISQRVNDYFPNNTLVPQFVTAYTTAYNNSTISVVYKQALSGAYNDIQFINNFIQLVNSGYGVSSAITSTPIASTTTATATPANVTFSGSAGALNGTLFTISGSGNTLSGSTDIGYTAGGSNWVSSGTITYSNGSFSGTLGNISGTLTTISGSGNTLVGSTDTGWVLNNGQSSWQNSGSITYNPSNNTFSGSIGDVSGSTFVLYGQGNQLVSQVNTNTLGSSGSGWQPAGSITATQS